MANDSEFLKSKIVSLFVLPLIILTNSCHNKHIERTLLAEKIEYDVLINNQQLTTNNEQADWWVKNIEGSKREALFNKIFTGLLSGKIKAFDNLTNEQLSAGKISDILKTQEPLLKIYKLRFTEKWYINPKTLEFEKEILSYCPVISKDSTDIPLFCIKQDTSFSSENIHPVSEKIQYDVNINNEQKTQGSELRTPNSEQLYWWKDNLETSKRVKFIDLILNSAFSGNFKTYDYFNDPVDAQKLKKEFYWSEKISLSKPVPPYDNYDTIINHSIDKSQITRLRFMEEWFWDDKSLSFIKKVKGICPIIKRYTDDGELKGYLPMFWIYTDKK